MNTIRKGSWLKFSLLVVVMVMVSLLGPTSALAAADTFTVNQSFPLYMWVYVPCAVGGTGETVEITGNMHYVYHITSNSQGGYQLTIVNNPQGISGFGLTTGEKYQGTGITRTNQNVNAGNEYTYINNFRIIGQGTGNNYLVHDNFHITVNADGTVTAYHDNFSIECK
jgi:hypothetical protein